ncbi:MAG: type II and III secretion system family protein [Pseudomonadota bacterium]
MHTLSETSFFRFAHIKAATIIAVMGLAVLLTGCDMAENQMKYDRSAELEREDYRRDLSERPPEDLTSFESDNIPALQPHVATPESFDEPMPLVSVSVNQTVPIRDLLFELTKQAGFDIEMDPQIQGSIIFTARNRPFDEVINRISDMAGLRYKLDDGLLRVQLDRPFHKTYRIDYVNIIRSLESNINLDVSVVSGDEAEVGSGASVDSAAESDFWGELNDNIEQILSSSDNHVTMSSLVDPVVEPVPGTMPGQEMNGQGDAPSLNVQFPTEADEPAMPNAPATFSINRQSGGISVYASHRQHNAVKEYLDKLRDTVMSQVLIEAKILEVSLSDEFSAGINWNEVSDGILGFSVDFARQSFSTPTSSGNGFTATLDGGNELGAVVSAISRFGTVRALSSPRLTVMNHQSAVLNVVENRVFFEFDVDVETAEDENERDRIQVDTDIRSVPEGIVISVLPAINTETGEISLALRPTVSSVTDTVEDPTPRLAALVSGLDDPESIEGLVNLVPQMSVQEIDSIVKMDSGEVVIMGGLMRDRNDVEEEGVPVLSSLPMFGNAFKNKVDRIEKTELVIFLKATLIPGSNLHQTDKELYRKYGQDRRPFSF